MEPGCEIVNILCTGDRDNQRSLSSRQPPRIFRTLERQLWRRQQLFREARVTYRCTHKSFKLSVTWFHAEG
jgi:hypothetical protein